MLYCVCVCVRACVQVTYVDQIQLHHASTCRVALAALAQELSHCDPKQTSLA
jgi:hypothetical protein